MVRILNFTCAHTVLNDIEQECSRRMAGVKVHILGRLLATQDVKEMQYSEYEQSFVSIAPEKIENHIRDALEKATTDSLFILPGKVYDVYFNDLERTMRRPNFDVVEERDTGIFEAHDL